MPNGRPAARVAFLPASCVVGSYTVLVGDGPPEDTWETSLREDGDTFGSMTWPAAQAPGCRDGHGPSHLEVGYHPFTPSETIHLVATLTNVTDATSDVELVPVYTSADATQPALTMSGTTGLDALPGARKPRSTTPVEIMSTTFDRATLPDGTAPEQWNLALTGCGGDGPEATVVTARVGDAAPIEIGFARKAASRAWACRCRCLPTGPRSPSSPRVAGRSPICASPSSNGAAAVCNEADISTRRAAANWPVPRCVFWVAKSRLPVVAVHSMLGSCLAHKQMLKLVCVYTGRL